MFALQPSTGKMINRMFEITEKKFFHAQDECWLDWLSHACFEFKQNFRFEASYKHLNQMKSTVHNRLKPI